MDQRVGGSPLARVPNAMPQRRQPPCFEPSSSPTSSFAIIVSRQDLDHRVIHTRVSSKSTGERSISSHLSRELRFAPARKVLGEPDPMLSPIGGPSCLHLRLGGGLRAFSLALCLIEASFACGGSWVPESLKEIGAVAAGLQPAPISFAQSLALMEGCNRCKSDPTIIGIGHQPPQSSGAGIWAEGDLEADCGIRRTGIFGEIKLSFEHCCIERLTLHAACSGHDDKGLFGIKRRDVEGGILGRSDLRGLIAEASPVALLDAAAASLAVSSTHGLLTSESRGHHHRCAWRRQLAELGESRLGDADAAVADCPIALGMKVERDQERRRNAAPAWHERVLGGAEGSRPKDREAFGVGRDGIHPGRRQRGAPDRCRGRRCPDSDAAFGEEGRVAVCDLQRPLRE